MRRRQFISGVGAYAVVGPRGAWAQQQPMPVVGVLNSGSPGSLVVSAFTQGLKEAGFSEGGNIAIEYRWADGRSDQLPVLAADLVRRQVTVIFANTAAVPAAKAATTKIPIVFQIGSDPVADGLVASLNRPGGNLTGVVSLNAEVGPKRLELLHEFVPSATVTALLVNPTNPIAAILSREAQAAAGTLGLQLHILRASTENELDTAFANLAQLRIKTVVIGADAFLSRQSGQLAKLALRYAVPSISPYRLFAAAGGLMSYGGSSTDAYRLAGTYAARVLKGEQPAQMPVQRLSKVEFIVNLGTAKAFGLTIPLTLLGRADEVIE